jgi:hypothetical protein
VAAVRERQNDKERRGRRRCNVQTAGEGTRIGLAGGVRPEAAVGPRGCGQVPFSKH